MTNELLPCPFCGCEAHYGRNVDPVSLWWVECMNPECWAAVKAVPDKEKATESWNKRPDHIPEMERLKETFIEWLTWYEQFVTRRWYGLTISECCILSEAQWVELVKEYKALQASDNGRNRTNECME